MKDINILYIEDDLLTAETVMEFLTDEEFKVTHTDSIVDAIALVKNYSFDIVLLDLRLQDYDGFEFLKSIKGAKSIPIIVISALNDTKIKVKAFRYGASDFMVKPIDLLELEARIWAVLGRTSDIKSADDIMTFSKKDKNIYHKDNIIDLTPIEYEIFEVLLKNRNNTVTRDLLINSISSISSHRTLDYHIKNIREKIGDSAKSPEYLKTVYGVGYKLIF